MLAFPMQLSEQILIYFKSLAIALALAINLVLHTYIST